MFMVLQNSAHHLLTAYGVAEQSYGGRKAILAGFLTLMGIGQGNAVGPCAYIQLSSKMVMVLDSRDGGVKLINCFTKTELKIPCIIFVDDNTPFYSSRSVDTKGEDIVVGAQKVLNTWQGCT